MLCAMAGNPNWCGIVEMDYSTPSLITLQHSISTGWKGIQYRSEVPFTPQWRYSNLVLSFNIWNERMHMKH